MNRNFEVICSVLCVAAIVMTPLSSHATDGYFSNGYGTVSKGMGGTGVALPGDAMTGATNPAGMVIVGNRFDIGMSLFNPERQYSVKGAPSGMPGTFGLAPGTVKSGNSFFGIPHLADNHMLTPRDSFGVLIYGNGGMNTHYPASASGGMGTFYGGETGVNLSQLFVAPTYARKVTNHLALGVSLLLAYQNFEARGLKNFGDFDSDDTPDSLTNRGHADSFGLGGKFGLLYDVSSKLTFGSAYQTQCTMSKFHQYSDLFAGKGSFDIPASLTGGLAYKVTRRSALAFDMQYIWYSSIHSIGNPISNLMTGMQSGDPEKLLGGDNGAGFGWRDMTVYKLGYQWEANRDWTLRTGVSYARQPIPTSEVMFNILAPGVEEWHFTAGFTKKLGHRSDFSMSIMYAPDVTVTGPNPFEVPGQQSISLRMHQFEIEANYGIKF